MIKIKVTILKTILFQLYFVINLHYSTSAGLFKEQCSFVNHSIRQNKNMKSLQYFPFCCLAYAVCIYGAADGRLWITRRSAF